MKAGVSLLSEKIPDYACPGRSFLFRLEFHNVGYVTFQQDAQLVDGIGGHVFSVLHGIVIRLRETHFEQSV